MKYYCDQNPELSLDIIDLPFPLNNDVIVDRVICTLRLRASMRHTLGTKHCCLASRNPLAEGWRSRDERIVHMRVMHLAERRAGRIAGGEVCLLSLAEKNY